jgi:hypothetical protein
VTPRWDESYQPPIYSKGRWKKVRPVLETYCDLLDDPQVVAMRRDYRERDKGSLVLTEADRIEIVGAEIDAATAMGKVDAEEQDQRRFALGLPGLHVTYPQVATVSIAVMATSQPRSYDCTTPCDFRGPFVELEPGLGGGKLSLGWARVTGNTNRWGSLLKAGFIGAAYKLTVLKTWGDLGWIDSGRTYAGFEFGLPVAQANVGIGLLYRVDSGDGGRWLVTGGAGWGF